MIGYIAAILAGAGIKTVDYSEDELKGRGLWKWPLAIVAGLAMGVVLSFSGVAVLFLAIIAAQVFMGKVDKPAHGLAVGVAVAFAFIMGIDLRGMELFLPFFIVAALDEVEFAGILKPMWDYRVWLKGAALAVGIVSGLWEYFLVLMSFDLAYIGAGMLMGKKVPMGAVEKKPNEGAKKKGGKKKGKKKK